MAAEVEVQSAEVGRAGGRLHLSPLTDSNNKNLLEISPLNQSRLISPEPSKPAPGPKPRLTPKPFTVDRNPTIKPILAPKPQPKPRPESTRLSGYKPNLPSTPKPQTPPSSSKPRTVTTNSTRPTSTSFRTSKLNAGQTTKPVAQPFKPAPPLADHPSEPISPVQKLSNLTYSRSLKRPPSAEWSGSTKKEERDLESPTKVGTSITRAKSMGYLLQIGQEEEEKAKLEAAVPLRAQSRGVRPRPVSAIYPTTPTKTESPAFPRSERRPLSADLTSKFESVGLSLHRKSSSSSPEEHSQKKEQVKSTTPPNTNAVTNKPATSDQTKDIVAAKDNEDMRGASIKSRISLLLDSSTSPVTPAPGQALDNTPTQTAPEAEPAVGVKQLIKQLTVDQATPNQSPVLKPALKPRPLPLDLTKRFSPDPTVSLGDASDRHDAGKAPEKRGEDSVRTPSDEKTFVDLKDSLHQMKTPLSEGPDLLLPPKESEAHMVRASVFENVVEKHSILMVDENKSDKPIADKSDDEGKLVTATYKEPVSPSGPVRIVHAFDTVPAAEGSTAVSESVPSAQWEDKAMTLRTRRLDGTKTTPEKTSPEQISNAPRYLRVGALPKWTLDDIDSETGMPKDKPRDFEVVDASTAAAKRLKTQLIEEQTKPRATYFALTGQMQETVTATSEAGDSMALSDPSAQWSSQGKAYRRNPSLDEAYANGQEGNAHIETQREKQKQLESERQAELEFARLKEREMQREFERQRQQVFEKEKQEFEEKQRAIELNKQIELERLKHLEFERQRQVELKRQRQMERHKQLEIDMQRQNELERQQQVELENQRQAESERQRQIELDKQRQLELKKQKQEFERQKQQDMERQKQIEMERQRQHELERQKKIEAERLRQIELEKQRQIELENQRQLELKKRKQELERQKQLEMERQKQLEAEKQRQIEIQRQKQLEAERQRQIELERQRQMELDRQRQAEIERHKQIDLEKQRQIELEKQKQIEAEKLKQKEVERQKQIELEKQRQIELERQKMQEIERQKQLELEKERQRQLDRERREMEKQRQREEERRQKELDKERKLMEKQIERQRIQAEAEEQERRQQAELQKQRERQQVLEAEKQRLREKMEKEQAEKLRQMALEQEMLRIKELDKERERQRELEREMERQKQREQEQQRQRELEKQRQKQLDLERQELEKQRLRQQEQEKERQRNEELERMKELERRQLLEFEKQKQAERHQIFELEKRRLKEKMERDEAERMRQVAKQQEAERQRLKDKQKKEEQERIRLESAALRPKVVDIDSVLRNDQSKGSPRSDPSTRWKEPSPKSEQSHRPGILDIDSFTSQSQPSPTRDLFPVVGIQESSPRVPQNSGGLQSTVWTTSPQDPWELHSLEMSVDKPEQPRKPLSKTSPEQLLLRQEERWQAPQRRWSGLVVDDPFHMGPFSGPETKAVPSVPVASSSSISEQVWLRRDTPQGQSRSDGPSHRRTQGSQELNRIRSRSMSRRSAPSSSAVESSLSRMRSRSAHRDQARDSWVQQKQNVSTEDESKDSETPVHETDSQYGTWETGLRSEDSLTPATPSSDSNLSPSPKKPTSPQTPADLSPHLPTDATDGVPLPAPSSEPLPFPDAPVTLLDNSALRSRAQLGKKRAPRTRPSRAAKPTQAEGGASDDWIYKDSTEEKVENKKEESDSEEQPKGSDAGPTAASSQPQRVALFPGMDPSALMAQLKKRGGESDNLTDGPTPPAPSQLSRSPKSPFLPRATRVLPPPGGKENGEEDSPQWLKELKSKKRLSQYENES